MLTITEYSIWRRIDHYKTSGLEGEILPTKGGRPYERITYPPGEWDFVKTVPARGESTYNTICPTVADSTIADGMYWSVFFVSAMTSDPLVYFDSEPDSGYSIDNLAPSTPEGLMAASGDTSISLAWNAIPDEDFRYYAIYRGTESGFMPDSSSLAGTTIDTAYSDIEVANDSTYYYRVSAFDFSGNESQYSDEVSCLFEGVHSNKGMELPESFSLSQNYPNPFNPVTEIRYAIPAISGQQTAVRLEVYNILGEKVATLVDEKQAPGYKTATWDASSFSSGIYFYRLQAGDYVQTRKMVLLR